MTNSQRDRRSTFLTGLLLVVLLAGGCSSQQLFEAIRENRLQHCEEIPIPQQTACKAQYEPDYDEYRREREALGDEQ
ncbi:MAG: hypothetical protein O2971_10160 [Proteobacteria bacterium]|nr:hypothetical protein [Pseudomonadota bacterium]